MTRLFRTSSSLLRPALSPSFSPSFSLSSSPLTALPNLSLHNHRSSSIAPVVSSSKPRTMSSAPTTAPPSSTKKEFLCIIPDHPGVVSKRLEVRQKHIHEIQPLVESGDVVLGGGIFHSHPTTTTETPAFKGSAMVLFAENEAVVREVLARDVYATSGVWDLDGVTIIPFNSVVRTGL